MNEEQRKKHDEVYEHYIVNYPKLAKVWCEIMEKAKYHEDELEMDREEFCQALVLTALDLIVKREDSPQISRPDSVRKFHSWCDEFLKLTRDAYITEEEQKTYERLFKGRDEFLFDGRNFGHGKDQLPN